jgi:hypothetical protein
MDACLSCFGRRRETSDTDDDQDPLLPKPSTSQAGANTAQAPRSYGAAGSMEARAPDRTPHASYPTLEKLVDVVAAFKAGKLPAQDQITRILQVLLSSEILKGTLEKGARIAHGGTGPTSARGLQVIQDLRAVFQAALEFSIEKNGMLSLCCPVYPHLMELAKDDNKVQEVFHQLALLNVKGIDVDFEFDGPGLPSFKVAEPATAALNAGKESVLGVKDQSA